MLGERALEGSGAFLGVDALVHVVAEDELSAGDLPSVCRGFAERIVVFQIERAVEALPGGGRIVVHGVTVEAEEVCVAAYRRWGGQLARLHHEHAAPIGRLLGWTPARAVVSWAYVVEGSR